MSQRIKSKIKSEVLPWVKKNPILIIILVILAFSLPFLQGITFLFGAVAVIEKEVLKSLIGAEATILGFFGLTYVYALTSLDDRMDRLEQQIFDIQIRSMKQRNQVIFGDLPNRIENIKNAKRKTANSALFTGALLFGSLLTSILGLGMPNDEWAFYLCSFSVLCLFFGIGQILLVIYDLRKSPETTQTNSL